MKKYCLALLAVALGSVSVLSQDRAAARQFIIDRAKSLELDTPYVPPPGDALEHAAPASVSAMIPAKSVRMTVPPYARLSRGGKEKVPAAKKSAVARAT